MFKGAFAETDRGRCAGVPSRRGSIAFVIGAFVRRIPSNVSLFEKLINVGTGHAARSQLCLGTLPTTQRGGKALDVTSVELRPATPSFDVGKWMDLNILVMAAGRNATRIRELFSP